MRRGTPCAGRSPIPSGAFTVKIEDEAARRPRADLKTAVEETGRMAHFTMTAGSVDVCAMEVATVMGAGEFVGLFLAALGRD